METPSDRYFLDTGYVIARFNRRDQYHRKAIDLAGVVAAGRELWTTDAVLLEVSAAFSGPSYRSIAVSIWEQFHADHPRYRVCEVVGPRLSKAVEMFRERSDKAWSLTDCLSFVVMAEQNLLNALTADQHFAQAG